VCFNTYGVKFPMFAVTPVRGADAHWGTMTKPTSSSVTGAIEKAPVVQPAR
jgi:glutathione peroxidase-family protein